MDFPTHVPDTAEEEMELSLKWISLNPFPSYNDMIETISLKMVHNPKLLDVLAEYGEYNHKALELCYKNIDNHELCKKIGQGIYNRGGFTALSLNNEIFRNFTPLSSCPNSIVRYTPYLLSIYWDGVGEWKH